MKPLFPLVCSVLLVSALDKHPITFQITSDKNSFCNNQTFFENFDWDEVPQFGAMCNIPPPATKQLDLLLKENAIPILCMGLFEVFQRQCLSATRNPSLHNELPFTGAKFNSVFKSLKENENFSLLDKFCLNTVKANLVEDSANKDSEFWWKNLNAHLKNTSDCQRICQTHENNKVQPLCSYIIWANGVYIKALEDGKESNYRPVAVTPTGENSDNSLKQESGVGKSVYESNQISVNQTINQSRAASSSSNINFDLQSDSALQKLNTKFSKPTQVSNISNSTNNNSQNFPREEFERNIVQSEASKNLLLVGHNTKINETVEKTPGGFKLPGIKPINKLNVPKEIESEKELVLNTLSNVSVTSPIESLKVDGLDSNVMSKTESVNEKSTAEKPVDITVESDITDATLNYGMEIEQPNQAGGEDGDDIEVDDDSFKSTPKKEVVQNDKLNLPKSNVNLPSINDGDSDKAYGEVREVIVEDHFIETEDSNFFTYFLCMVVLTVMGYLVFHNKKKLFALALEGRRTRSVRRRPNSSNYSKLDCSLEEAMASNTTASVTQVLY